MAQILLIDDDSGLREMIHAALASAGHTVSEAADGDQGLALLAAREVDVIITDIMMPEKDGFELLMKLRMKPSAPPIVAMTGHGEVYMRVASSLGATRVLKKPFSMGSLIASIDDALNSRRL